MEFHRRQINSNSMTRSLVDPKLKYLSKLRKKEQSGERFGYFMSKRLSVQRMQHNGNK